MVEVSDVVVVAVIVIHTAVVVMTGVLWCNIGSASNSGCGYGTGSSIGNGGCGSNSCSNSSRGSSYSVRNSLLIIPHNTFWDCCVHILSDNLSRNSCIWKSTKVYTAFRFMGHTFCKEDIEDTVKLLESIVFCSLIDNNGRFA